MYLHYAVGRTPTDAIKHTFWQEEYLKSAQSLLNDLLDKKVIYLENDLKKSLKKRKIPEIKEVLRSNKLKLSGNKDELINRLIDNQSIINLSELNLEPVLTISTEYHELYHSTDFINYAHHNNYIDIFEIYNYYQSSPGKSKHEIIIGTMVEKYKIKLEDPTKHDAKMLSGRISDYYLTELNDISNGYYYLNCSVVIQVMQNIESYRGMLAFHGKQTMDNFDVTYLFKIYDKNIQTYKKLFYTNQIKPVNIGKDIFSHTKHLPYDDSDKKLVSNFVFYYFKDREEAEEILKYEIEKRYYSNNKQKPKENENRVIDSTETGFKRFMKSIFK
ncbi:SAP domain-containing protein [Salinicoccus sp. HZC-1]|uniref:SAP domain-containing protein n=1 Tax=Salinicoccus sp. HZC-1 TaxID=3385497 RepID=UPI00398B5735